MNNSNVAHLWASQGKPGAKGSNFFFEAPVIYSYGRHFPIANRLSADLYLFTSRDYSKTTCKHKLNARRAIPESATVFTVPNVLAESARDHEENAAYLVREYRAAHDRALKAIKRFHDIDRARELAKEAAGYCYEFSQVSGDIKRAARKAAKAPFTKAEEKTLAAKVKRGEELVKAFRDSQSVRYAARRAAEEARRREVTEKLKTDLEAWAAGTGAYDARFYALPVRLRVVTAEHGPDRIVETSHGANVPLAAAVRLLGAWQAGTVEIGAKIGHYTVEAVTPDLITIGCHKIDRAEAERVIVPAAALR